MMIYLDDQFRAYDGQDAETTRMPWERYDRVLYREMRCVSSRGIV